MSELASLSGRHNVLTRWRGADDPATVEAARDLGAARIENTIKAVQSVTPLRPEQLAHLRDVLAEGT